MPTNPLRTIKESIENLRENIWTFDKNENDIINVDFDEAERENAINTSSVCLKKILIHSTDKVFFLKTLLVDLVYLIYKVLYFRFIGTKSSKQIQRQSAF